jgi:hypothetical protein
MDRLRALGSSRRELLKQVADYDFDVAQERVEVRSRWTSRCGNTG